MPAKQEQRAEINTFVQGLITEASPLNFPTNASREEENFELNRDGTRQRRLGMDLETLREIRNTGISYEEISDAGLNTFKWQEVSGDPSLEFLVLQFNQSLHFYDLNKDNLSLNGYLGELVLSEFPVNTRYSFSAVEGILVAVAGIDSFAVISYEEGAFSYYLDRIKIRDLFGVEEVLGRYEEDISYRGSFDSRHFYNLQNQSWGIPRRTTSASNFQDPITAYRAHYGFNPSNGEAVWLGMEYTPGNPDTEPYERLYPRLFRESWGAEISTAKGYYIIDALRRGQSRIEEVNRNKTKYPQVQIPSGFALPSDLTEGGPSCVAEYSGRMFFSGFKGTVVDGDARSPNYTNYVFFSILVKNKNDLSKCYQEGDPTGRETADLVDTDGGFLRISEAKDIHTLVNMGTSLVVIASNGVWRIDGGSDYGFSATNYRVEKVSSFGGLSSSTVVLENNRLYYWADDGIYTAGTNELGDTTVDSISIGSIQKLYDEIPTLSKQKAKGVYDSFTKKVRWIYNTGPLFSEEAQTSELILDVALGAFSLNKIKNLDNNIITVVSLFQTSPYTTGSEEDVVYAGEEQVFVADESVIGMTTTIDSSIQAAKYLAIIKDGDEVKYCFSYFKNVRFKDWEEVDGVGKDAKAFCLTGHVVVGDSGVKKQIPYLTMHLERTEEIEKSSYQKVNESSCLFRCHWDFSNNSRNNKFTPLMQAYRSRPPLSLAGSAETIDNGFEVVTSKNKVRGSGKAFSLYFETEPEKDCRILGWNLTMTGNSVT